MACISYGRLVQSSDSHVVLVPGESKIFATTLSAGVPVGYMKTAHSMPSLFALLTFPIRV